MVFSSLAASCCRCAENPLIPAVQISRTTFVFGNPVVATALLDRLLHHAIVIQIEGASYRLRAHTDAMSEHTRSYAAIVPTAAKTAGRPLKNGRAITSTAKSENWKLGNFYFGTFWGSFGRR